MRKQSSSGPSAFSFKSARSNRIILRIATAFLLIPFVLGAVVIDSPYPLAVLTILAAILAIKEWAGLIGIQGQVRFFESALVTVVLVAAGPILFFRYASQSPEIFPATLAIFFVGFIFAVIANLRPVRPDYHHAWLPIGAGWIVFPLAMANVLKCDEVATNIQRLGTTLLLLVVPLWVGDSFAYFVGSWIGRHKLAPKISPGKSVEGAVANFVFAVLAGVFMAPFVTTNLWVGGTAGALVGIFGQCGDLYESWLKRKAGAKDSGGLLPGHGGVLDRIDSLLFAAPVVVPFLYYFR